MSDTNTNSINTDSTVVNDAYIIDETNSESKKSKNDDGLENLLSQNEQSEKIRKHLNNRIVKVVVVIPFALMLGIVIVKTIIKLQTQDRVVVKEVNTTELGLKIDSESKWKAIKDQQIGDINTKIDDVSQKIVASEKNINEKLKTQNTAIGKKIDDGINNIKTIIKENNSNFNKKIDELSKKTLLLNTELSSQKKHIEKKLKEIQSRPFNLPLPKLQPLRNTVLSNNSKSVNKGSKVGAKNTSSSKKKEVSKISDANNTANVNSNTEDIYEEVSEDVEVSSTTISLTNNQTDTTVTTEDTNQTITFSLRTGFAKAMLINGGKIPVSFEGSSQPAPIFMRITDAQLISNNETVNLNGCILIGTGKADLSKKGVEIRLSSISCNMTDADDVHYKLDSEVQGWVFSENGEWGVSGRLVSREGEILKAGIPLSLAEGMINTLSNVVATQTSNSLSGDVTSGTSSIITPSQGMTQGFGTGGQTVLQKFSDYYMKILDSLTPVISIRAGREVVVAFKGGEELTVTKYTPIDTDYFNNQNSDDGDVNDDNW